MKKPRTPSYRRQKQKKGISDRAFVEIDARRVYLGTYGSPESHEQYDRIIAEYLAHGRRLPNAATRPASIEVVEVLENFWRYARHTYRNDDGSLSSEGINYRVPLSIVRALYGRTPALEFTPQRLKTVRHEMVRRGWSRKTINRQIGRLRTVFKWAVAEGMIDANVYAALCSVDGLRRGRSDAPDRAPVKPVAARHVDALRPHVSRQVWALIELQRLTAARPGELLTMRPRDLNTTSKVWTYSPESHKTAHHGHDRTLYLGPKAQQIVAQFLAGRALDACLFSPAEAEAERREALTAQRTTPTSCGNRPGSNRTTSPQRCPGDSYTVAAYRRAITRGCDAAFPLPDQLARKRVEGKHGERLETPAEHKARLGADSWAEVEAWRKAHRWHPHQLRHSAATALRKQYGIEVARLILGHRSAAVTEIYAEADHTRALEVMGEVG